MLRRIVSALVLVPVTLGLVLFAPAALYLAALGVVGSLCLHEYFQMMRKIGLGGQPWFGHAGFWFLLVGFQTSIPATLWSALALLAAFLVAMGQKDPIRDRVDRKSTRLNSSHLA